MSAYSAYNMNTLLLTTLFRMAPNSSNRDKATNPNNSDANLSKKAATKVGQSIFKSKKQSTNDFKDEFRH